MLEGLLLSAQKDVGVLRHDCDGSEASKAVDPGFSARVSESVR